MRGRAEAGSRPLWAVLSRRCRGQLFQVSRVVWILDTYSSSSGTMHAHSRDAILFIGCPATLARLAGRHPSEDCHHSQGLPPCRYRLSGVAWSARHPGSNVAPYPLSMVASPTTPVERLPLAPFARMPSRAARSVHAHCSCCRLHGLFQPPAMRKAVLPLVVLFAAMLWSATVSSSQ